MPPVHGRNFNGPAVTDIGQMRTLASGFPKRPFAQLRLKCIIDA